MAHSRTERIGTIFTRITLLLKGGAMSEENLPLWYNVYKAFPPTYEPSFNRSPSEKQIQNIFYKEDIVRAKFQQNARLSAINLRNQNPTETQMVLQLYECFLEDGLKEEQAYDKAYAASQTLFKKTTLNDARFQSKGSHKSSDMNTKRTKT